jgi:hypothetical protein
MSLLSTLLGVLFIALKICGVIHWSWLWVLCPFWISFLVLAGGVGVQLWLAWSLRRQWAKADLISRRIAYLQDRENAERISRDWN